jgi:hypothetical protein
MFSVRYPPGFHTGLVEARTTGGVSLGTLTRNLKDKRDRDHWQLDEPHESRRGQPLQATIGDCQLSPIAK